MFTKFNAPPGLSGIPTATHGLVYRLTHPHSQARPRRGYHRPSPDVRFDMSALPDFERVNNIVLAIGGVTGVIVPVLWWMLLS